MGSVSNTALVQNPNHNGTEYVAAWLRFMTAEELLEEVQKLGPDVEVYGRRLIGVEWAKGGGWQTRIHDIMGSGSAEAKLMRLFSAAKKNPACWNNNGLRGWKLHGRTA